MAPKLIAWWNSLPAALKAVIVVFAGAATGVVRHIFQNPNACMTEACWKGYLVAALHAGGLAVVAYLLPSPLTQSSQNVSAQQGQSAVKILLLVAFLFVAASPSRAQLPNPKQTPGAVRTTSAKQVCSTTTGQFRNTTEAMKKQACAAYGIKDCPKAKVMELDHLISLELGGADEAANLWPQLAVYSDGSPGFHVKDKLENDLHRLVCSGKMTLADAQQCIRSNWIACAKKVQPLLPAKE